MYGLIGGMALALLGTSIARQGERLAAPALRDYVVGHQASNGQQSIREEVPRGQTVERWTRMVTTQRFTGVATQATPVAYAQTIVRSAPQSCPGARISPVVSLTVSGRPAARFQLDCPNNGLGGPETFILLAIAGQADMHVKQVAFRGGASAADLAWGQNFLAGVRFCSGQSCP